MTIFFFLNFPSAPDRRPFENDSGHFVFQSNSIRDSLAKALYCRTVATIVRRANSLKRISSTLGTLSSDSNDSVHNQAEVTSQHASTVGTAGSKSSKSMAALNNAVNIARHATDGSIGILDMFGFEEPKVTLTASSLIATCTTRTNEVLYCGSRTFRRNDDFRRQRENTIIER